MKALSAAQYLVQVNLEKIKFGGYLMYKIISITIVKYWNMTGKSDIYFI